MRTIDRYLLRRAYGTPGEITTEEHDQLDQLGNEDLVNVVHDFLARDPRFLIASIDRSGVILYLEARRGLHHRQRAELRELADDVARRYPGVQMNLNVDPSGAAATVQILAIQPAIVE